MPGCSAKFCQNRREQGFLMHVFPRDPKRRAEWTAYVKRENWEPTKYCYLCEAHFEEDQFELHRQDGKVKLKPYAVPTIFHYTKKKPSKKPRFLNESGALEDENSTTADVEDVKKEKEPWTLLENVCNAKRCTSYNDDIPVMLFPFPENEERCQLWVERCQNNVLTGLDASELCLKAHLCSKHFEESQFADLSRESLIEEALPSLFAHPLPMTTLTLIEIETSICSSPMQEEISVVKVVAVSPNIEDMTALTYEQLCLRASQVKLPSSLWAVHKDESGDSVAFVHTDITEHCIDVDRAVVFQKSCQSSIYFNGQRVLLGMEKVNSLTEIETILERVNSLTIKPSLLSSSED